MAKNTNKGRKHPVWFPSTPTEIEKLFYSRIPHTDIYEIYIYKYFRCVIDLYNIAVDKKDQEEFDLEKHLLDRKKRWTQFKKLTLPELLLSCDYLWKKKLELMDEVIMSSPGIFDMINNYKPKDYVKDDIEFIKYVLEQKNEFYTITNNIFLLHERIDYVFHNGMKSGQKIPEMKLHKSMVEANKQLAQSIDLHKELLGGVSQGRRFKIDVAIFLRHEYPKDGIHVNNLHRLSEEKKEKGREYLREKYGSGTTVIEAIKTTFRKRDSRITDYEE